MAPEAFQKWGHNAGKMYCASIFFVVPFMTGDYMKVQGTVTIKN